MKSIEGTIIYPVTDSIPQGIIMIPAHPHSLSSDQNGTWIYFQAMKWTQQELLWEVTRCKKERVVVEGINNHNLSLLFQGLNDCYITYGKLNLRFIKSSEEVLDSKVYSFKLSFGGDTYAIIYQSPTNSFGVPISFECLEW